MQAIPILNDALAALDTIKEADIGYIKKLGNPPSAIKLVRGCAAALEGQSLSVQACLYPPIHGPLSELLSHHARWM